MIVVRSIFAFANPFLIPCSKTEKNNHFDISVTIFKKNAKIIGQIWESKCFNYTSVKAMNLFIIVMDAHFDPAVCFMLEFYRPVDLLVNLS